MRGIVRPCRHSLPPELRQRWRSHLCGLCLTLRDEVGQTSRVLTGYDVLLVSVLVEGQRGPAETVQAGPCPLRGFRPASVVAPSDEGARASAAAALLAGAGAIDDKFRDAEAPRSLARPGRHLVDVATRHGARLASGVGWDTGRLSEAAGRAAQAERPEATLDELLAPTGEFVAIAFAQTADIAGRPDHRPALWAAGDAFGRLVHLIDAVQDAAADARRAKFNPLAATGTSPTEAYRLAERLHAEITGALERIGWADESLVRALFGPSLRRTIDRTFRGPGAAGGPGTRSGRVPVGVLAAALVPYLTLGLFRRRRFPRSGDPYYGPPPGYGYGYGGYGYRRGPGCCDLLACDCCANMACADCCGDDDCCVCCC